MSLPFKTPMTSPGLDQVHGGTVPRLDEAHPGLGRSDRYQQFERESSGGLPDDPGAALPVTNPVPYKRLRNS